jgi:MFS family permease
VAWVGILTVFAVTYLTQQLGMQRSVVLDAITLATLIELFVMPLAGWLSDTIGRRTIYLVGTCILEQWRFQPAIVCKTRVLLIPSATVRFIGSRYSGFRSRARPPGSFNGPDGWGGASSALIAPAGLARAAIGVLDHGGDPRRWRHHSSRSPSFAFASLNFIFENRQSVLAAGVASSSAHTKTAIMAICSESSMIVRRS